MATMGPAHVQMIQDYLATKRTIARVERLMQSSQSKRLKHTHDALECVMQQQSHWWAQFVAWCDRVMHLLREKLYQQLQIKPAMRPLWIGRKLVLDVECDDAHRDAVKQIWSELLLQIENVPSVEQDTTDNKDTTDTTEPCNVSACSTSSVRVSVADV